MPVEHKKLSLLVKRMFPDFVSEDYPMMITFFEKVFAYMEQEGNQYDIVANLLEYNDVDLTRAAFEDVFKHQYLQNFPDKLAIELGLLVKNIRSFYLSKGTEDSFKFLFAALFDTTVNFVYPKFNILRVSDGLWFTPEYLVLKDDEDRLPPLQTDDITEFNVNNLIDSFITGATSGAVAYIDSTRLLDADGLDYQADVDVLAVSILEKEGAFLKGEQILVGDTLVENGDFSNGLNFWVKSDTTDSFITVANGQVELKQELGSIINKYISQEVTVEEDTQYYIRYSLVSADAITSKVTVGYAPGTDEVYNSTNLGTSPVNNLVLMPETAAGKVSMFISIHNEMTTANQACVFDGVSLVKLNPSSSIPLLFIANEGPAYTDLQFFANTPPGSPATITRISSGVAFDSLYASGDSFTIVGSSLNEKTVLIDTVTPTLITLDSLETLTDEGIDDVSASLLESGILSGTSQWKDQRGWLSEETMNLQDNFFYQDYSYQLVSTVSIASYESIIKDLVHPSGFKMFGDVQFVDTLDTYAFGPDINLDNPPISPLLGLGINIVTGAKLGDYAFDNLSYEVTISAGATGFDLDIIDDGSTGVGTQIEMTTRLGFGNTWADAELNREVNEILVGDWDSLIIGDFDTFATSRFGFIFSAEITVTP